MLLGSCDDAPRRQDLDVQARDKSRRREGRPSVVVPVEGGPLSQGHRQGVRRRCRKAPARTPGSGSSREEIGPFGELERTNEGDAWPEWQACAPSVTWARLDGSGPKSADVEHRDVSGDILLISGSGFIDTAEPSATASAVPPRLGRRRRSISPSATNAELRRRHGGHPDSQRSSHSRGAAGSHKGRSLSRVRARASAARADPAILAYRSKPIRAAPRLVLAAPRRVRDGSGWPGGECVGSGAVLALSRPPSPGGRRQR